MNKPADIGGLKWDADGLIPAVVQDAATGEVLTLAYVSRESLVRTTELGETVFYSRSRRSLWHKGETSGHTQKVVSLMTDCDEDSVIIQVRPHGPACHTGARSCFFQPLEGFPPTTGGSLGGILRELEEVIRDRKVERPEGSYTASLFDRGLKRILQKVGEEATETVLAGMGGKREEMITEASDLIYHLLVALAQMDIAFDEVATVLRARRK